VRADTGSREHCTASNRNAPVHADLGTHAVTHVEHIPVTQNFETRQVPAPGGEPRR